MMTPWITAAWSGYIGATASICLVQGICGAITTNRRYRLAWTQPAGLIEPPAPSALVRGMTTALAVVAIVLAILLLAPMSPLWRPEPWAGPVLVAGAFASAGSMFRSLQRHWSIARAALASAIITIGSCGVSRMALGNSQNVGSHLLMLVVGFALSAALWTWLSGVWLQQLDGGQAWTVAGRLISLNRIFAVGNGVAGVFTSWWLSLMPRSVQSPTKFFSAAVIAVLVVVLALSLRRWWGIGFVFLLIAGLSSLLMLISFGLSG